MIVGPLLGTVPILIMLAVLYGKRAVMIALNWVPIHSPIEWIIAAGISKEKRLYSPV